MPRGDVAMASEVVAVLSDGRRPGLPSCTSASQLATYSRCPRQYEYRYVLRAERERRAVGLALGSAVHSALGWWFEERAQERAPTIEDVERVVVTDLAAATAFSSMAWSKDEGMEDLELEARALIRTFLAAHADLPVSETDVRFDMLIEDPDTGEVLPRPLLGYFDAELAGTNVLELKTTRKSYSDVELRTNLQFAAYRTIGARMGVDVEIIALVRTKTPKLQHVLLKRDPNVSQWFIRAAVQIERAILARHFPPAPGQACACCEYKLRCTGDDDGPA